MRQRKLGSHTPPCHRRMVITTLFSVLLAALQRRPVLYHTWWGGPWLSPLFRQLESFLTRMAPILGYPVLFPQSIKVYVGDTACFSLPA